MGPLNYIAVGLPTRLVVLFPACSGSVRFGFGLVSGRFGFGLVTLNPKPQTPNPIRRSFWAEPRMLRMQAL